MAISVNRHTIVGRVGSDPDSIPNSDGVRLSVATSEFWKDRQGEKQERTTWHRVVVWPEPTAKFVKKYVKKGDLVYVEGQIETRSWDKDGSTQYITETVIRPYSGTIQLQSKDGGEGRSSNSGSSSGDRSDDRSGGSRDSYSGGGGGGYSRDLDDDIPF